jgi:hypothetical protein
VPRIKRIGKQDLAHEKIKDVLSKKHSLLLGHPMYIDSFLPGADEVSAYKFHNK